MVIEADRSDWSIGIQDQGAAGAAGNRVSQSGANARDGTELNGARAKVRLLVVERHSLQKGRGAAFNSHRRRRRGNITYIDLREDVVVIVAQIESPLGVRSYCRGEGVAAIVLQVSYVAGVVTVLANVNGAAQVDPVLRSVVCSHP